MTKTLQIALGGLIFLSFVFIAWKLILLIYGDTVKLPIFLDDWIMIWGVAREKSLFINPAKVQFYFEAFPNNYALRTGFIQVWLTYLLYHFAHLNNYWYLFSGLVLKLFVSISIFVSVFLITKNLAAGIISGLLYTANPLGGESLTWFIGYGIYVFLGTSIILLPVFIKNTEGKAKNLLVFILSLIFLLYIYSERAFLLAGFTTFFLIWPKDSDLRKRIGYTILTVILLYIGYRFLFQNAGGVSEAATLFGRVGVIKIGLSQGKTMFLTYPFGILAYSIIPSFLTNKLLYLHQSITLLRGLPITEFRFWNFLAFPALWFASVLFVARKMKLRKGAAVFWILLGLLWSAVNLFLRTNVFHTDWDWIFHFLFIASGYIILFTLFVYSYLKNNKIYGSFVKMLLSSLILILSAYSLTWMTDPLIAPGTYFHDRYVTTAVAFGIIYFGTLLGLFVSYISRWKSIVYQISAGALITLFVVTILQADIKDGKYYVDSLLERRSQVVSAKVLSFVSGRVKLRSSPRTLIFVDPWDYIEVLGILPPGGHSIELARQDLDPEKLPFVYYDKALFEAKFQQLCKEGKTDLSAVYRFKVYQNGKVEETTKTLTLPKCIKT